MLGRQSYFWNKAVSQETEDDLPKASKWAALNQADFSFCTSKPKLGTEVSVFYIPWSQSGSHIL